MRDPGLGAHPAEIVSLDGAARPGLRAAFPLRNAAGAPRIIDPDAPPEDLRLPVTRVRGRAPPRSPGPAPPLAAGRIAARIGRSRDWRRLAAKSRRPAPLYVRAADAAPPKDPAPVILP